MELLLLMLAGSKHLGRVVSDRRWCTGSSGMDSSRSSTQPILTRRLQKISSSFPKDDSIHFYNTASIQAAGQGQRIE